MLLGQPRFPSYAEFLANPERCRHVIIEGYRRLLWQNRFLAIAGIVMVAALIAVVAAQPPSHWDYTDGFAIVSILLFIRAGIDIVKVERSILPALYSLEDSDWSTIETAAESFFGSRPK